MRLTEQWTGSDRPLTVGDSLIRTVTVEADGLLPAQLPDLVLKPFDGIQVYAETPEFDSEITEQGVVSRRTQRLTMVITRPGQLTVPVLQLDWWDTVGNRARRTQLPARTLTVLPDPEVLPAISLPATDRSGFQPWYPVPVLAGLWLITLIGWGRYRRGLPSR